MGATPGPGADAPTATPLGAETPGTTKADLPTPTPDIDPAGATSWGFADGADVTIAAGQKVLVDRSINAGDVTIQAGGALLVADADLTVAVRSMMIHGTLQAGTMADPLTQDVTFELTDTDASRNLMGMGAGVIGAMDTGVVKIYGNRGQEGYVHLAATAAAGSTSLSLDKPLSLVPGDVIVVGATGFEPAESERCTVASTAGTSVTCAAPLIYEHLSETGTFAGTQVAMRAPVALLTRNVVITQSAAAKAAGVPGHTHFMGTGAVEIMGVQADGLGAGGKLGHYPFHMHDKGSAATSFFAYSSVIDSDNRGFVVHMTNDARVIGNVADQVAGQQFMIGEDGPETGTLVAGNLGTRATEAPQPVGAADDHATNFWLGSGAHDVRDNEAAGAEGGWGFIVESVLKPTGIAGQRGDTSVPARLPFGLWQRNTAHSISQPEEAAECVFFGCGTGVKIASLQPVREGSPWYYGEDNYIDLNAGVPWGLPKTMIYDTTVWKTEGFGVWADVMLGFERLKVLDTRDGFLGVNVLIDDSLFVGDSGIGEQKTGDISGVRAYDGHRDVKDTAFVNYVDSPARRAAAFSAEGAVNATTLGWYGVSAIDNITYDNATPFYVEWGNKPESMADGFKDTVLMWDLDGTVTGLGAKSYITFLADSTPGCKESPASRVKLCSYSAAPPRFTDGSDTVNRFPVPDSLPEIPDQPAR